MTTKMKRNDMTPEKTVNCAKVVTPRLEDSKVYASEIDLVGPINTIKSESEVDLVPKDAGWAWMCCLGGVLSFVHFGQKQQLW